MTHALTTTHALATNAGDDDQLVELWLRKQRNSKTWESYGQTELC